METYNKAYLYYLTDNIDRPYLTNFMWGEFLEKEKLSKKDEELLNTMQLANSKLDVSNKEYWETWINGTKGYTKKRLKKYYEEIAVYSILNDTAKTNTKETKTTQENQALSKKEINKEQIEQTINAAFNKSVNSKGSVNQNLQTKQEAKAETKTINTKIEDANTKEQKQTMDASAIKNTSNKSNKKEQEIKKPINKKGEDGIVKEKQTPKTVKKPSMDKQNVGKTKMEEQSEVKLKTVKKPGSSVKAEVTPKTTKSSAKQKPQSNSKSQSEKASVKKPKKD